MSSLESPADIKAKIDAAPNLREYQLAFVALLGKAAGVPSDELIVVGGSAIEVYTEGKYTSGDVDIVSSRGDALRRVLVSWEFRRTGRVWQNEAWGLVVDLVKPPYTGSLDHTTVSNTPFGQVRLAALEDLIVKRLMSTRFWKVPGDRLHALMLAEKFYSSLDWKYIEAFATREEVADLAAELRAEAGRSASHHLRRP